MTEPNDFELLELATPYALDAVSDEERADIDRRLAAAPRSVAAAFGDEVRAVRETMAVISSTTAVEPPARLRSATLAAIPSRDDRKYRWRTAILAATAAAVVVGAAAFGVGILLRPHAPSNTADQVLAAPDVRTISGPLGNGTATVVFSHDRNAGVLVMNNVAPPKPGTVYQMWLMGGDKGPTSAGTMNTAAVAPLTTATLTNLGSSTALAFTVEPGTGSPQPTGTILAELPLT